MSESKAMIIGCAGVRFTVDEVAFISEEKPWGLILFARNVGLPEEISALTARFRDLTGREDAPVFIDQEGGRVQRIREPIAPPYPSGASIGALYKRDPETGRRAAWVMSRLHAADLLPLGINADCLPVLDVPVKGAHDVIGDRAYGYEPETVATLGGEAARGLMAGGVLPVIKHIPGHGRAFSDSHLALPVVDTPLDDLRSHDFPPFRGLKDIPMAMTAHVVFSAIDPEQPATTSPTVVRDIIREEIGFDGLLMSDDVSMKALSGDFAARTGSIFGAGCDVVLHCNGMMEEMLAVASKTPVLEGEAANRAARALRHLGSSDGHLGDAAYIAELRNELAGFLAAAA
ncbi:beta-N-acetylhexosaminidase [Oricola cellulosilytica]|uniref:beta-N-acetylhexosaminidase n=1 Tax=Oricola cellulosilytica TaxID=1429082 RepID=A0A4R0P8M0_9HYPH|nr:beta-N-acetylhexosaminidase [Oricola cellulosilytica]TCD12346.1 beta-N-acetylhexosaminidase [Oricola cellulosilytica]